MILHEQNVFLTETGPGSPSVDDAIGATWHGPKWAVRSLIIGILGAVGAHIVAALGPAPEPAPAAEPEPAGEPQAEASPAS